MAEKTIAEKRISKRCEDRRRRRIEDIGSPRLSRYELNPLNRDILLSTIDHAERFAPLTGFLGWVPFR